MSFRDLFAAAEMQAGLQRNGMRPAAVNHAGKEASSLLLLMLERMETFFPSGGARDSTQRLFHTLYLVIWLLNR